MSSSDENVACRRLYIRKSRLVEAAWELSIMGLLTGFFTVGAMWAATAHDWTDATLLAAIAGILWGLDLAVLCYWVTR